MEGTTGDSAKVRARSSRVRVEPRLLRRERAASYLDVSVTKFDQLVREGLIPAPKRLQSMKCWDRDDLDDLADRLPYIEMAAPIDTSWDD